MDFEDDPHLGQGRSKALQESQMTTLEFSFIILLVAVVLTFIYVGLESIGWVPRLPPIVIPGLD